MTANQPSAKRLLARALRRVWPRPFAIIDSAFARLDQSERSDAALRADIEGLARQQAALVEAQQIAVAFGWDHVALVRRLAVLEDRLAMIQGRLDSAGIEPDHQDMSMAKAG